MVITHNLPAMNAERQYTNVSAGKAKSTEKLSSGYRINRAADDAAGLSISEKMRKQIRGLNRGAANIKEGVGYCQTADGALAEVHDMCQRLNVIAIQAANGTNSESDRRALDNEVQQLKTEITRVFETTRFNEEFLFKIRKQDETIDVKEEYDLDFFGAPDDLYIYNSSYDDVTGETRYGGIALAGTRYSWDEISPRLYNADTNTFNEGRFTYIANNGEILSFESTLGSEPPKITRRYTLAANGDGIYVNGNRAAGWDEVINENGVSFNDSYNPGDTYYVNYHGIKFKFTTGEDDTRQDVYEKLNGIEWKSEYIPPVERTAVTGNVYKSRRALNNTIMNSYFHTGSLELAKYIFHADETGVYLVDKSNDSTVIGSEKTWAELGITNWGNLSSDIWDNFSYHYNLFDDDINGMGDDILDGFDQDVNLIFKMIIETSRDSTIGAIDGITLAPKGDINTSNNPKTKITAEGNLISGSEVSNKLSMTMEEEHLLGRDFDKKYDDFSVGQMEYDGDENILSMDFPYADGTSKIRLSTQSAIIEDTQNKIVEDIKGLIDDSIEMIAKRYMYGAKDPQNFDLVSNIGNDRITGGGADTYLSDVLSISDRNEWVLTGNIPSNGVSGSADKYAAAKIDFSGLGTDYSLADLIGTGLNSTCQTCSNHYSILFVTDGEGSGWRESFGGLKYKREQISRNDYTFRVDVSTLPDDINGTEFTNKLVAALKEGNMDFHYSQYATRKDDAVLYVIDNRGYVENDSSTASNASFSPAAYDFNAEGTFDINLVDENNENRFIRFRYDYDFKDAIDLSNLVLEETEDENGLYVKNPDGSYTLYNSDDYPDEENQPTRYNITSVRSGIPESDITEYVMNTVMPDIASKTKVTLQSNAFVMVNLTGRVNDNKGMVTDFDKPYQIPKEKIVQKKKCPSLKIQCSSEISDIIIMDRELLNLKKLHLQDVNVLTAENATYAIGRVAKAIAKVSDVRSLYGAYQNRLEHSYNSNLNKWENTQAAESRIRDTDMAKEMFRYSMQNILEQAGQSMLAQANQTTQGVLSLLG